MRCSVLAEAKPQMKKMSKNISSAVQKEGNIRMEVEENKGGWDEDETMERSRNVKSMEIIEEGDKKEENNENKDHLMKLLAKQKLGGFWEAKPEVISLLGKAAEQIFDKMPKEIEKKEIWLTIVVVCFLELKFPKSQGAWTLISQKAVEYLEDLELNFASLKQIALDIFK